MPTAKRVVMKPVEEKFAPPVAEVVPETPVVEVEEKVDLKEEVKPVVEEKKVAPIEMPESKPTKIKWGLFYAGSLIVVLVAGFSGGLWWGYRQQWGMKTSEPVIAEATPAPTPEATPVPINRGEIIIDVSNGSGKTGFAGEMATKIKDLGYGIGTVGNAASQTSSTLALTEDLASRSAEIVADLKLLVGEITVADSLTTGTSKAKLILGSE